MKIKTKKASYEKVAAITPPPAEKPKKPSAVLSKLINVLSRSDLKKVGFTYTFPEREKYLSTPCLILMNHSSFIDLEIVSELFYPMPYNIVITSDGMVGKYSLMRSIGCIPTKKFVTDYSLVGSLDYALNTNKTSVLLYPEASYSFDGTATPLPRRLGILFKKLAVPVVMVKTYGAFSYDPLYNCLQKRKVPVSAEVKTLFTPESISELSVSRIDEILDEEFSFDSFKWQKDNNVRIDEPFRADGLHRILYKCPHCGSEGKTIGEGIALTCSQCGKKYVLDELGQIQSDGGAEFSHVPDWYKWQRECVKREIEAGKYCFDIPVKIGIIADYKAMYEVGEGRLVHNQSGFTLTGCNGALSYSQSPLASYGLYADYFWYEIGDMICIGNSKRLYYCFPTVPFPVAKARLAAEELYKIKKTGAVQSLLNKSDKSQKTP